MIGIGLLGKSVYFTMIDGSTILMKVTGYERGPLGNFLTGHDDESMNTSVEIEKIDTFYIPGGKNYETL